MRVIPGVGLIISKTETESVIIVISFFDFKFFGQVSSNGTAVDKHNITGLDEGNRFIGNSSPSNFDLVTHILFRVNDLYADPILPGQGFYLAG